LNIYSIISHHRKFCDLKFGELNPRERIGFTELSAKWRIGSPLLLAESASIKKLP
jgi:hypothetical protein